MTKVSEAKRTATRGGVEPKVHTIKSADRTIEVLEVLAENRRRMTLSELQRDLGVPKSSLHGLLQTLVQRGWVDTDERGDAYGIGLRALRIGTSFLDRDPTVQAGEALLAHLGRQFEDTMHLARLDQSHVVYLASREAQHHVRERSLVGRRLPAHATALGQALLSTYEWDDVEELLPETLEALTRETITDRDELRRVVEQARERGWAQEVGQTSPGLVCVAVAIPIIGPSRDAISCAIPSARATDERVDEIVQSLQQTARDLSVISGGIRR